MNPSAPQLDITQLGYAGSLRIFQTGSNRLMSLESRIAHTFIGRAQKRLARCLNNQNVVDGQVIWQVEHKLQKCHLDTKP